MKNKKYLIILILKILESHTDQDNPKTQKEIADEISSVFPCERKTVGRNMKFLKEIGYPIIKTGKGFYLEKTFTLQEINYIMAAINSAPADVLIDKEDLLIRVKKELTKSLKRIKKQDKKEFKQ